MRPYLHNPNDKVIHYPPGPAAREVTMLDMEQLDEILNDTILNPYQCFTKPRLIRLCTTLLAQNVLLKKALEENHD